jgi:hypothetical protein
MNNQAYEIETICTASTAEEAYHNFRNFYLLLFVEILSLVNYLSLSLIERLVSKKSHTVIKIGLLFKKRYTHKILFSLDSIKNENGQSEKKICKAYNLFFRQQNSKFTNKQSRIVHDICDNFSSLPRSMIM